MQKENKRAVKILYLHGFASCGVGQKSMALKSYFGEQSVWSPDLPVSPLDAMVMLERLLEEVDFDLLVGSSLGGFYATYLAKKYQRKYLLLNPSTQPWVTLAPYTGWQERFCDGEMFEFKPIYLKQLESMDISVPYGDGMVLLQSEDEVLDYTKAESFYNKQRVIVEYGGNHRFENITDYLCMIDNFID